MSKIQVTANDINNAVKNLVPGLSLENGILVYKSDKVEATAKNIKLEAEATVNVSGLKVALSSIKINKDGIDVDFSIAAPTAK